MVLVVALAYDEHYVAAQGRAAVNAQLARGLDELVYLPRGQLVGKEAEGHAVYREVKLGLVGARKLVLHVAYVVVSHEPHEGFLVLGALGYALLEHVDGHQAHQRQHHGGHAVDELHVHVEAQLPAAGHQHEHVVEHVDEQDEQHPAQVGAQQAPVYV